MPKYDFYHNVVRAALIKDGWIITDDPFIIEFKGLRLYADLGAERLFTAIRDQQKIVVEIKVFNSLSLITELQKAVGQYNIYRTFIHRLHPDRKIYLAIANDIYLDFFQRPAIQEIILDQKINLLVFDPNLEEIIQWIS
ncbi:fatty-acid synthase [Aphanothece hegewaldii CCALA 016]|uniref:Fatty-acid synthase n=1 Tax=Aphanothece hegewaldii CCALA 016 TaxID=2107694 RepID=A0A2T1M1K8_9CHRO|nr:element excision factor XisH family protein [Aphanothece hegewaldii]PSF38489.1 fatty-acid synthase [Aphanothece hegewaldii CCALA 016]